jgi:hypothetical protein
MGSAVGLTTRLCTGEETTYGTVDLSSPRFLEFDSESLERKNEIIRSNALGSGSLHLRRGSRSVVAARHVEGSIGMEVVTNGMGRLFRNLLGGTPTIAQQGGTTAYLQTHTLGSLLDKSLTIQKQLRDESDAVVAAFTHHGCKFVSGEFKIDKKGKLMLSLAVDGEDVDTATAAASPSLTATKVFHYRQGALTIGGVAAAQVQSASVKVDRKMDTDRFHLGNAGVKGQPLVNDFPDITGSLSAEFTALTYYNLFAADTAAALVLEFTGDVISGIYSEKLTITIPEIRLTGEAPKVGGPGLVIVNHPWEAQWDGSAADMTLAYISTDTAI